MEVIKTIVRHYLNIGERWRQQDSLGLQRPKYWSRDHWQSLQVYYCYL